MQRTPPSLPRRPLGGVRFAACALAASLPLATACATSTPPAADAKPPAAAKPAGTSVPSSAPKMSWAKTYEEALSQAKKERKLVLVDFYTSWCGWCKRLDSDVFSKDSFLEAASGIVGVKVDAEARRDIAAKFNVSSYPRLFFLSSDGVALEQVRGYLNLNDFTAKVKAVKSGDTEYRRFREAANNPDDLGAVYTFARWLTEMNQLESSIHYWQQVHDQSLRQIFSSPQAGGAAQMYHRQALLQLGRAYASVGLADVAKQNLSEVLSAYPGTPEAQQAQVQLAQLAVPVAAPAKKSP